MVQSIGLLGCASDAEPSPTRGAGGTSGSPSSAGATATAGAPSAGAAGSASSGGAGTVTAGSSGASSGGTSGVAGVPTTGGTFAAGGTSAAGGALSEGGGTATAGASATSPPGFFTAGYLKRDPWLGYVFTVVDKLGSTVSPVCTTTGCTPAWGTQACASGSVKDDPTSGTFAGLAFHVNDPMVGERGIWTSTGTGIYVSVTNPPASARLQLQEKVANADTRYCAPLPVGGTGLIPFSAFKTYCWGDAAHPSKVFAVGTDVHEVTVIIPGNSTAAQPFNFCLVDIQPR